ncbi:7-carboxy-7-deazaguanine synthase QueE, partial [Neisseria sp. P0022.S007]
GAVNIYDTICRVGVLNSRAGAPVHW